VRQIGTLPCNLDHRVFGDHLLTLGMKARFDEQPEGWVVWIYNEDHTEKARSELETYLSDPDDPRFRNSVLTAQEIRRKEQKLDREYRKNFREVTHDWAGPRIRNRPLTLALVAASLIVFLLGESSLRWKVREALVISPIGLNAEGKWHNDGLQKVLEGQVWRLVTPIFLHFDIMHILFNTWALTVEGTIIESRRGMIRLAVLVLVSAVASNLGQFFYMEQVDPGGPHPFGGMSGVCYALFGYLWMKGQYEPEQGMILHPNTIALMLFWLVLCMAGVLGPIANAAHVVGLLVGVAFGVAKF
jgi:GlpG protein